MTPTSSPEKAPSASYIVQLGLDRLNRRLVRDRYRQAGRRDTPEPIEFASAEARLPQWVEWELTGLPVGSVVDVTVGILPPTPELVATLRKLPASHIQFRASSPDVAAAWRAAWRGGASL